MKLSNILKLNEVGAHYAKLHDNDFNHDPYYGRDIIWMGEKGRMVRITPENSEPIWGNEFDMNKIQDTADAINDAEDRVKFNAPLVVPWIVDIQDVEENIKGNDHGDLMFDPVIGDVHHLTTDDDELDKYLFDPETFLDDNSYEDDDRKELEDEMEERKKDAQKEEWGDIGDLRLQVRDGNHRRAAAFAAGERYIYGLVSHDYDDTASIQQYLE